MGVISSQMINPRTVGRLIVYGRILDRLDDQGTDRLFSRDLALLAGASPSLVRQDLMNVAVNGTPKSGYSVPELSMAVRECLGTINHIPTVILGAGHLGLAILHFFQWTQPHLKMTAVFEINPALIGQSIHNIPICHTSQLEDHLRGADTRVAILTLPAEDAQPAADRLVAAGVSCILNFTSVRLQLPKRVFVENNDIQLSLERVAFYASDGRGSPTHS